MKDRYYEAALRFCQEHGYEGDELPAYKPGLPSRSCPIAGALRVGVGYGGVYWPDGTVTGVPDDVLTFMHRADTGEYRQLGIPHDLFEER